MATPGHDARGSPWTGQSTGHNERIMIMESGITLRAIALDVMGVYATDPRYVETVEAATAYAVQLGYRMAVGTGGAYADHHVSKAHAEIIADLLARTDADGVYPGDRGAIAALLAGTDTDEAHAA